MNILVDNPALLDNWISSLGRKTPLDVRTMVKRRTIIAKHLQAMDSLSSDRRIQYLADHGLADADIRQLLSAIQRVIDRDYGETIRQMAAKHARQGGGLDDVVADFSNTNIIQDLAVVCYQNDGETDVIAAAYANHELYYTVNAALNIAKMAEALRAAPLLAQWKDDQPNLPGRLV